MEEKFRVISTSLIEKRLIKDYGLIADILDKKLNIDSRKFFKRDENNNLNLIKGAPYFNFLQINQKKEQYQLTDKEFALLHIFACKLNPFNHKLFSSKNVLFIPDLENSKVSEFLVKNINDYFNGNLQNGYLIGFLLNPQKQLECTDKIIDEVAFFVINFFKDDAQRLIENGKITADLQERVESMKNLKNQNTVADKKPVKVNYSFAENNPNQENNELPE